MNYFPNRLYQLRRENNETQAELADMFGMTRATLSAYEKGKITPPYDKVVRLASHFNVTVDYLLGQTDARTAPETLPSEDRIVDVMEVLRTLDADVRDKSKVIFMNGRRIDEERESVTEVVKSIIKILEKMQ